MSTMLCGECIPDVNMEKQNIFNDKEYCKLLSMCMYKCPYGLSTFIYDSHMSDTVMALSEKNVTLVDVLQDIEEFG
jgi:hypothetical protein